VDHIGPWITSAPVPRHRTNDDYILSFSDSEVKMSLVVSGEGRVPEKVDHLDQRFPETIPMHPLMKEEFPEQVIQVIQVIQPIGGAK
jgi:hypothetical protein